MSRQRQNGKRSDARSGTEGQRHRRQTSKFSQTPQKSQKPQKPQKQSAATTARAAKSAKKPQAPGAHEQQLSAQSPQPDAATPKTGTGAAEPAKQAISKATAKKAATRRALPAVEMAPLGMSVTLEEPAQAQMPDIPEIPEVPETPEIPATPDTPDTPEIPEVPGTPEEPGVPEQPEMPEEPEIPEEPAEPEIPETPEKPNNPNEPTEPEKPNGSDNPTVRTPEQVPADETDVGNVPVVTERRMPTLAVMAKERRGKSPPTDDASMSPKAISLDQPETNPDALDVAEDVIAAPDPSLAASADGTQEDVARAKSDGPAVAFEAGTPESTASAASDPQSASNVTRPVFMRFSNRRRKEPRVWDFKWEDDSHLSYLPWPIHRRYTSPPQPLPMVNWLVPVIVFHIFVMALMGVIGALEGYSHNITLGTWMLAGAAIAGAGAVAAYIFGETKSLRRFAPYMLVASQLGLLAWAMLLIGPRASLLALIPVLIEVALLMSDTLLASLVAVGAMLIYAFFAGLAISTSLAPVSAPDATGAVALDVICVVVGLLAMLWLLLTIESGREHAQAIARARLHEAEVLRRLVTQFRQETQDNTARLESALLQALQGQAIGAIPIEGMYRLLAETIVDTASRLEVLQTDREERLRLEGALRVVIRAVERQWLGVEPQWPDHTGTALDELVALLRTPRLDVTYEREAASSSITPRIIPIPTLTVEHSTPPPAPISRPLSSTSWLATHRRSQRPDIYPLPSANEATDGPSHPNDHPANGSGTQWNTGHYWADPYDE